ncbi:hypothetical protein D3C86_2220530 [compost metagenome]
MPQALALRLSGLQSEVHIEDFIVDLVVLDLEFIEVIVQSHFENILHIREFQLAPDLA